MKLRVEVTTDDIAAGVPMDPCACPLALALRRHGLQFEARYLAFPGVCDDVIEGTVDGKTVRARMTDETRDFVARFDGRTGGLDVRTVSPSFFDLEFLELGAWGDL